MSQANKLHTTLESRRPVVWYVDPLSYWNKPLVEQEVTGGLTRTMKGAALTQ
jgi:hypothetical protein